MAIISVYIPDGDFQRALDAICNNYQYQENFTVVQDPSEFGGESQIISVPNPQTKSEFVNQVLGNFIKEHVKSYEIEVAKKQAEQQVNNIQMVSVDNGSTATVYNYHMICLEPARSQYDALAQIISPGNTFSIPLSSNGEMPVTHYALEAGITETARQQLLILEFAGGTSTGGIQTLFYVRCDPITNIAQATNIVGYDIIGQECNMTKLLQYLGLQEC